MVKAVEIHEQEMSFQVVWVVEEIVLVVFLVA